MQDIAGDNSKSPPSLSLHSSGEKNSKQINSVSIDDKRYEEQGN